jgi:hypothetical protein
MSNNPGKGQAEDEKTKTVVEMKRRLFMTEKEKKEEQTVKQRAELGKFIIIYF